MTSSSARIALYIGNEMYPAGNVIPAAAITTLQASPLTSAILSLLNNDTSNDSLVYNDGGNPMFDNQGNYTGPSNFAQAIAALRNKTITEVYLSFSTNGTDWLAGLLNSNPTAAASIMSYIKNGLGVDGVDLDYEGDISSSSNMYPVADAAIAAGLKLTAAPYWGDNYWQAWVKHIQSKGGSVSWLNLQCYAGGKSNNPGDWNYIGVPIVAGSCMSCGAPQTTCSPQDMQDLFRLWCTGQGSVSQSCWNGTPNTQPQTIGGGFIWAYSSIKGSNFLPYMNAIKKGLGI